MCALYRGRDGEKSNMSNDEDKVVMSWTTKPALKHRDLPTGSRLGLPSSLLKQLKPTGTPPGRFGCRRHSLIEAVASTGNSI